MDYELEAVYLNDRGTFKSRKTLTYDSLAVADDLFTRSVAKLITEKTKALLTLRSKNPDGQWFLLRSDRT